MGATDEVLARVLASHKFAKSRDIEDAREWGRNYHQDKDLAELLFMRGVIDRRQLSMARKLAKMSGGSRRASAQGEVARATVAPPANPHRVTKIRRGDPQRVGRYEVLEKVAQGGMGVIYKARHPDLDRVFALKLLTPRTQASEEATARFEREAKTAARLDHPNIVRVYDAGVDEGAPYLVMDFVDGPNLGDVIKEDGVGIRKAAQITRSIALALHHAHQSQVVHRDVKPDNIILERESGDPKITDFGIVKVAGDDADDRLTQTGYTLGSPCYMAPEQAEGLHDLVGPRADIYSLAATLYEMLCGEPPFDGDSIAEIMTRVVHDEPVDVQTRNQAVPRDLAVVCMKALEKEPERRYASARDLAEDLDRFLSEEPVLAKPVGAWTKALRVVRRNRAVSALLLIFFILGAVGLGMVWRWRQTIEAEALAAREKHLQTATLRLSAAGELRNPQERRHAYYEALKAVELVLAEDPKNQEGRDLKRDLVKELFTHLIESGEPSFAEFVLSLGAGVLSPDELSERMAGIEAARFEGWREGAEAAEREGKLELAAELYRKGLRALTEAGHAGQGTERLRVRIANLEARVAEQRQREEVERIAELARAAAAKGDYSGAFKAAKRGLELAPDDAELAGRLAHYREKLMEQVQEAQGAALGARARVGTVQLDAAGNELGQHPLTELLGRGNEALDRSKRAVSEESFADGLRELAQAQEAFESAYALASAVRVRVAAAEEALAAERRQAARYAPKELGEAQNLQFRAGEAFERGDYVQASELYTKAAAAFRRAARTGNSKSVVAEARAQAQSSRSAALQAISPPQRTERFRAAEEDFARAERFYDQQEYEAARELYLSAAAGFDAMLAIAPRIAEAFGAQSRARRLHDEAEVELAQEYAGDDYSRAVQSERDGAAALAGNDLDAAIKAYTDAIWRFGRAIKQSRPHAESKREYDALLAKAMDARQYCVDEELEWKPVFKRAEEHLIEAEDALERRYWNGAKRHVEKALKLYLSLHK